MYNKDPLVIPITSFIISFEIDIVHKNAVVETIKDIINGVNKSNICSFRGYWITFFV